MTLGGQTEGNIPKVHPEGRCCNWATKGSLEWADHPGGWDKMGAVLSCQIVLKKLGKARERGAVVQSTGRGGGLHWVWKTGPMSLSRFYTFLLVGTRLSEDLGLREFWCSWVVTGTWFSLVVHAPRRRIKPTYPEQGRRVCAKISGSCEIEQVFEASTAALMAEQRPGMEWKEKSPKPVSLRCHKKAIEQTYHRNENP